MNWYHLRERFYAFFTGKKPRRKRFNFEVHLIDSCNLNCKGCVHFAPLAKPSSFYPLEEFEKEIKRLSELFGGRFGWIHIMGGEPLLNPNINDYLDECVRAVLMWLRWRSGKWEGKVLVKAKEEDKGEPSLQ